MKMVRSLLLGSAAGFVAVAGAQAADMPVKAKPVEYVKICSLYGAGFYYLPGTDICVKHGAYVRSQWYYGAGASPTNGPFIGASGQNSQFFNQPNDLVSRARSIYTLDARTQTEYGTLRAYVLIGFTQDWPGNSVAGGSAAAIYATRGFIQFAGFTLGKATSFYDIWSVPANSYFAVWSSDTGDAGQILAAYTFQFGNGFSATLAVEDPRRNTVTNATLGVGVAGAVGGAPVNLPTTRTDMTTAFLVGAATAPDQGQVKWPDIVANLRVDQAWGSFQVMGALHDASGGYWTAQPGSNNCFGTVFSSSLNGQLACGHPDDELGWAVGVGGIFKVPMPGGLTDVASFQVNYTEGATRYVVNTQPGAGNPNYFSGSAAACNSPTVTGTVVTGFVTLPCLGSLGLGYWSDGIYGNPSVPGNPGPVAGYDGSIQKTKAWGVNAAWDHLWTTNLKTSVYGAFIHFDYNAVATALIGSNICLANQPLVIPVGQGSPRAVGTSLVNLTNCNPDFSVWMVGSRTQWNITPSFYVGFDVMYQKLETAFAGFGNYAAGAGLPRPGGAAGGVGNFGSGYEIKDQDTVSVTARAHWDILP